MTEDDTGWGNITDTTITWNNQGNPEQYTISDYIVGPLFWLSWTENQTLVRKPSVRNGVKDNPEVFMVHMEWDSLPQNTFDSLGFHHCDCNTSSIGERDTETSVTIYPNPVSSNEFRLSSEVPFTNIEVITLAGKPVQNTFLSAPVFEYNFVLDRKLSGVYFVRLTLENGRIATRKLIFK
jgi:hypothetical protein